MNSNQVGQLVAITDAGASINWTDNSGLNINLQKSLIQSVSAQDDTIVQITMYSGTIYSIYFWENERNLGATSAADLVNKIQELVGTGGGGTNYWMLTEGGAVVNIQREGGFFNSVYSGKVLQSGTSPDVNPNAIGQRVVDQESGNLIADQYITIFGNARQRIFDDFGNQIGIIAIDKTGEDTSDLEVSVKTPNGVKRIKTESGSLIIEDADNKSRIAFDTDGNIVMSRSGVNFVRLLSTGLTELESNIEDIGSMKVSLDMDQQEMFFINSKNDGSQASMTFDAATGKIRHTIVNQNGIANHNYLNIPSYANHAAADADNSLLVGSFYLLNGQQSIQIKR